LIIEGLNEEDKHKTKISCEKHLNT